MTLVILNRPSHFGAIFLWYNVFKFLESSLTLSPFWNECLFFIPSSTFMLIRVQQGLLLYLLEVILFCLLLWGTSCLWTSVGQLVESLQTLFQKGFLSCLCVDNYCAWIPGCEELLTTFQGEMHNISIDTPRFLGSFSWWFHLFGGGK